MARCCCSSRSSRQKDNKNRSVASPPEPPEKNLVDRGIINDNDDMVITYVSGDIKNNNDDPRSTLILPDSHGTVDDGATAFDSVISTGINGQDIETNSPKSVNRAENISDPVMETSKEVDNNYDASSNKSVIDKDMSPTSNKSCLGVTVSGTSSSNPYIYTEDEVEVEVQGSGDENEDDIVIAYVSGNTTTVSRTGSTKSNTTTTSSNNTPTGSHAGSTKSNTSITNKNEGADFTTLYTNFDNEFTTNHRSDLESTMNTFENDDLTGHKEKCDDNSITNRSNMDIDDEDSCLSENVSHYNDASNATEPSISGDTFGEEHWWHFVKSDFDCFPIEPMPSDIASDKSGIECSSDEGEDGVEEKDNSNKADYSDDNDGDGNDDDRLVRYDGWSSGGSSGGDPFVLLGTDRHDSAAKPHVLTPSIMESLRGFLPFSISEDNFWLKYSLIKHGSSRSTLLERIHGLKSTIIAIETINGDVFGSFTGTKWETREGWYGSGEAFLWKLKKCRLTSPKAIRKTPNYDSEMEVYPYTGSDRLVQLCTSKAMAVGGGEWANGQKSPHDNEASGVGLLIYTDLQFGETNSCATFANKRLNGHSSSPDEEQKRRSDDNAFEISNLEVWTLSPCNNIEEAESLEMRKLFVEENKRP